MPYAYYPMSTDPHVNVNINAHPRRRVDLPSHLINHLPNVQDSARVVLSKSTVPGNISFLKCAAFLDRLALALVLFHSVMSQNPAINSSPRSPLTICLQRSEITSVVLIVEFGEL